MMRMIWILAACALQVWSGFAWLSHGLVEWLAAFAGNHAGQLTLGPELAALLVWLADLLVAAGGIVIVLVWLTGCVAIALLAWILSRLMAPRASRPRLPGYRLPPGRY
jgi:hypothetical protein